MTQAEKTEALRRLHAVLRGPSLDFPYPSRADLEKRVSEFTKLEVKFPDYDERTGTGTVVEVVFPIEVFHVNYTISLGEPDEEDKNRPLQG